MTIKLIQIGNSKGIRLPKTLIEKFQLKNELEIVESEEGILIKPVSSIRKEWDTQFKKANSLIVPDDDFKDFIEVTNEFDTTEWKW
jgi:antitoxin MazE